jgi:hypothetical protein
MFGMRRIGSSLFPRLFSSLEIRHRTWIIGDHAGLVNFAGQTNVLGDARMQGISQSSRFSRRDLVVMFRKTSAFSAA